MRVHSFLIRTISYSLYEHAFNFSELIRVHSQKIFFLLRFLTQTSTGQEFFADHFYAHVEALDGLRRHQIKFNFRNAPLWGLDRKS